MKTVGRMMAVAAMVTLWTSEARLATAQGSGFTEDELRTLPRICLAQRFINRDLETPLVPEAERKQWEATLGSSYQHYHHFCWGLIYMRRGAAQPAKSRYNYESAVTNFQYVIKNSDRSFALLPEVHLRKGMALRFLGEDAASAKEFLKAVALKKDYSPAYAELVQLHLDLGDMEGARTVLQTGLTHAPKSKLLAQKKLELDGGVVRD